jgi:Holliday junction resolvase RusA-like endonuclease
MATQAAPLPAPDPQGSGAGNHGRAVLIGSVYHLSFFIPGKPIAKARPRVVQGNTFTPEKTRNWEDHVGWSLREQITRMVFERNEALPTPFDKRVIMDAWFYFNKPKSTPKKVTNKITKPDYDNLAKSITDAMEGMGLIKNDSIVTDASIHKRFATPEHPEGVEVELTCWT